MPSILVYDRKPKQQIIEYTQNEEFNYASTVLETFIEAFTGDGFAKKVNNKSFTMRSTKNNSEAGFFINIDKSTKKINGIIFFLDNQEFSTLSLDELTTLSTNEDIIFPICVALEIA